MSEPNANIRLEAFCDGVFAIALTLLIIEIKPPAPATIANTADLWSALDHRRVHPVSHGAAGGVRGDGPRRAFWFPTVAAIVTTLTWIFWAVLGIRMKAVT